MVNGLTAQLNAAPAPAYVDGDLFSWDIKQRYLLEAVREPGGQRYQFDGVAAEITLDFVTPQLVTLVCVLFVDTGGATPTINAQLRDSGQAVVDTELMALKNGVYIATFPASNGTVHDVNLVLSNASGIAIGWIWAGEPFLPTYGCSDSFLSPAYLMSGAAGFDQLFVGEGSVGEFTWQDLSLAELRSIYGMVSWAKRRDNEPVIVMENMDDLETVAVVRFDADRLRTPAWQSARGPLLENADPNNYPITVPFAPVYRE